MSILGFSIVGNSKMTFIFILGYPNPRKGALRGGLGGLKGVCGIRMFYAERAYFNPPFQECPELT